MVDDLTELRTTIDEIDTALLELIERRAAVARKIGVVKERAGRESFDPRRKGDHIRELAARSSELPPATVSAVFGAIHDATLGLVVGATGPSLGPVAGSVRVGSVVVGDGCPREYIAGPCAIESASQVEEVVAGLAELGVRIVRGGAFKPRTSPGSFQGLGRRGLELIRAAADGRGLAVVAEAVDAASLASVLELADVVQVGTRNALNYSFLRTVGALAAARGKPVLMKRGFGSPIREWLAAAEYIVQGGTTRLLLCERGIRTFETETRATLDLAAVPIVHRLAGTPVVVDVSHAAGRRDIVGELAAGAFAVGADAVMVEVHPDPDAALSDAGQQLTLRAFAELARRAATELRSAPTAGAGGRIEA